MAGPTTCHKTELSIELAKRVSIEIVSADSVQVYFAGHRFRKTACWKSGRVRHHLIDCLPIDAVTVAAMFRDLAHGLIGEIVSGRQSSLAAAGCM